LGLNIRLKSDTFTANIYTPLDMGINGSTATVPLEVFTQRNFVADFNRLKLNFHKIRQIRFLSHHLG